jgi:hypothetical protein
LTAKTGTNAVFSRWITVGLNFADQQTRFIATGSGIVTSVRGRPDGVMLVRLNIEGRAFPIGRFTGFFVASVPRNGPPIDVQCELRTRDNAIVRIMFELTESDNPGNGGSSAQQTLHGVFSVTGGTGRFMSVRGGGPFTVFVRPSGLAINFGFDGSLTYADPVPMTSIHHFAH